MSKPPAFQFYPGDWLRDPGIRACSLAARGLWIEMLCLMHQAEPYGHLKAGTMIVNPDMLSRMVGAKPHQVQESLKELEDVGVFSRSVDGIIYSRRMVKDEATRRLRAQAGKLGGNPKLLDKHKVNQQDNHEVNRDVENLHKQNLTPSSSSSSSSSSSNVNIPPDPTAQGDDCLAFFEAYLGNCGTLPRVNKLTALRKQKIRARLKENPDLAYWIEVIKKLAASEKAREWASLDWVIENENNHVKAIEGNYDDRTKQTEAPDPYAHLRPRAVAA